MLEPMANVEPEPEPRGTQSPSRGFTVSQIDIVVTGMKSSIRQKLNRLRVMFDPGMFKVTGNGGKQEQVIEEIMELLREHDGRLKITLEGNCERNEDLGIDLKRSHAVFERLVEGGIPAGWLRVTGRGKKMGPGTFVMPTPIWELVPSSGPFSDSPENPPLGLYFDAESDQLAKLNRDILAEIAKWLLDQDESARVEGHVDKGESPQVGQRRAQAVCGELVRLGVRKDRLTPIPCASTYLMSSENAKANRRVEIQLVQI